MRRRPPTGNPSEKVGLWFPVGRERVVFILTPWASRVELVGPFGVSEQQACSLTEIEQLANELLVAVQAVKGMCDAAAVVWDRL